MSLPRPVPEELRGRVPLLAAAYAVMTREGDGGTEVLLQLRRGTGFMDGWWACGAAGHVEDASAPSQALAREVDEELGVRVHCLALGGVDLAEYLEQLGSQFGS